MASLLGVTKQNVWFWKQPGRQVPVEHCPAIEQATAGKVKCEELRPDIPWGVLRVQAAPCPEPDRRTADRRMTDTGAPVAAPDVLPMELRLGQRREGPSCAGER